MAKTETIRKKKIKYNFSKAIAYIHSTFNNTIVTIVDEKGNVLGWSSSGSANFKGAKKSTPFAAQTASGTVAKKMFERGIRQLDVNVKGPGPGRESAIRALVAAGLKIISIRDITPVPHNGCRPEKRPRG